MKCKFSLLLFLCVLSLWGQAQSLNLQELVNKKQFQEVVARADSLTPADSADYATMSAIGQAYEGLLRYKEAYQCFSHCLKMDTNNVDALNAVARNAINFGRIAEAKQCYRKVLGNRQHELLCQLSVGASLLSVGRLWSSDGTLSYTCFHRR